MKANHVRTGVGVLTAILVAYGVHDRRGGAVARVDTAELAATRSAVRSVLPTPADAQQILNTTRRHREWATVQVGQRSVLAWTVYPERSDKAPVVLLKGERGNPSDWVRAITDQLAAEGFIAIAATAAMEPGDAAAMDDYAAGLLSADGQVVTIALDPTRSAVEVSGAGVASQQFALSPSSWPELIAFLNRATGNKPVMHAPADDHAAHFAELLAAQQRGPGAESRNGIIPASQKRADLPASILTSNSALARTRLRHEWVDIETPTVKLRTWVSYPEGNGKAGVVVVMQQGPGNDMWERALADQLAREGFIAVAPDLFSGLGPNGGGFDDFQFLDEAMGANAKLNDDLRISLYKAARDWALTHPRANGKTASLGFCAGGSNSFRFAGEVPDLNAAVVYYGGPPNDAIMAGINAPVLGFYGEDDARVTATVEPASATMKKLGKSYEAHVYPQATHAFLWYQEMARNYEATVAAWPRTMAFLKQHLE